MNQWVAANLRSWYQYLTNIAKACGYTNVYNVTSLVELYGISPNKM